MRTSITLATLFFFSTMASAQEVQKCCGTSSSTFLLGSTSYARHTQCLYAPGELTGAVDGNIYRLYYRYGVSGIDLGNTLGDVTISMIQTSATAFTGVDFLTGLQTVLQADSLNILPGNSGDWFSFELDSPFTFDPALSLVVDIRFETSANTAFGTMSVGSTTGRKIMSDNTSSATGETWTTLQDIGFDLMSTGISSASPAVASLYPNPSTINAELVLAAPLSADASLTLVDVTGRTVVQQHLEAGTERTGLAMDALPAGVYMLQLNDAKGLLLARRLVRE